MTSRLPSPARWGRRRTTAIYKVTFDKKENPTHADYNYGNFSWHMDRTDTDLPPLSSILSAEKTDSDAADRRNSRTRMRPMRTFPSRRRSRWTISESFTSWSCRFRESIPEPTEAQLQTWRSFPPKTHPLVWHHRSGRKSLVLSTSASHVVGMDEKKATPFCARLMAWATQPEYVYRHEWQLGDAVMWDNTGTMHRVLPYLLHLRAPHASDDARG